MMKEQPLWAPKILEAAFQTSPPYSSRQAGSGYDSAGAPTCHRPHSCLKEAFRGSEGRKLCFKYAKGYLGAKCPSDTRNLCLPLT